VRAIVGAVALTISSGATMGHSSGVPGTIYWYLLEKDANTVKLAACSTFVGVSGRFTTTAMGAAADSANVLYADEALTDKPGRIVAVTTDTQTTAGTYTALPSLVELWPFTQPAIHEGPAALGNGKITVTHNSPSANDMTIAVKTLADANPSAADPVYLRVRNATEANGDHAELLITGALSVVVPAGATLGFSNSQKSRVYVGVMSNAGAAELLVYHANGAGGILGFEESNRISTTAIGTGSDSASVAYSTSARSNLPWRLVAWCEVTTGATAGNWATAASKIQPMMPGVRRHGDIVQIQFAESSGSSTASTSATDVTGATVTITPTSDVNAITVRATAWLQAVPVVGFNTGNLCELTTGGGTVLDSVSNTGHGATAGGGNSGWDGRSSFQKFHRPASASAQTYKLRHRGSGLGGGETVTTGACKLVAEEVFA